MGGLTQELSQESRIAALEASHEFLYKEYMELKSQLEENTKLTKDIHANTSELVDVFRNAKGANKVIIGLAKWLSIIGGSIAILLTLWHQYIYK